MNDHVWMDPWIGVMLAVAFSLSFPLPVVDVRALNIGLVSFVVKEGDTMISRPFWWYSDPYSSPYFVPSQEPAFGPVLYLWTCFGPQDAISDQSPPAHYFRISGLPLVLFLLAPPTRRLNHPISTLSLTLSFRAPPSPLQT